MSVLIALTASACGADGGYGRDCSGGQVEGDKCVAYTPAEKVARLAEADAIDQTERSLT